MGRKGDDDHETDGGGAEAGGQGQQHRLGKAGNIEELPPRLEAQAASAKLRKDAKGRQHCSENSDRDGSGEDQPQQKSGEMLEEAGAPPPRYPA
jgi:hypothetical protein